MDWRCFVIACDKGSIAAPNKKGDNGTYVKYYPSSPFSPSVALGALLTRNSVVGLRKVCVVKRRCLFRDKGLKGIKGDEGDICTKITL